MSKKLLKKIAVIALAISLIVRILGVLDFVIDIMNSTEIAFSNLAQLNDYVILFFIGALLIGSFSSNNKHLKNKRLEDNQKNNKTEKFLFLISFLLILSLGVFTRMYKLGENALRDDELYVNSVAYNLINEGDFYKWDWILETSGKNTSCLTEDPFCEYTRAWPYTLLVSTSYKLLGVNEFSTRLPGAVLGVLSILIVYFIAKYFLENKRLALLPMLLFTLSPLMILWSRYARMYSLLIPLFLLTAYFLFRGLNEGNSLAPKDKYLRMLTKKLDYNYNFIFLGLLFSFISYQVHIVSLIIFPLFFLYLLIRWLLKRKKRDFYLIVLIMISLTLSLTVFNSLFQNVLNSKIAIGEIGYRMRYKDYLLSFPLSSSLSLMLLILLFISSLWKSKRKSSQKSLFLTVMLISSVILYTTFIDTGFFIDSRYISFLIPFAFIGLIFSIKQISVLIDKKLITILFYILIITSSIISFSNFYPRYYTKDRVPDLNTALVTIKENYEEGELVITNSVRSYYLRGIKTKNIVQMTWRRGFPFRDFKKELCNYDSGWIYWEEDKISTHISPEIYYFAEINFKKLHGLGVDDTNVDVYYYEKKNIECN